LPSLNWTLQTPLPSPAAVLFRTARTSPPCSHLTNVLPTQFTSSNRISSSGVLTTQQLCPVSLPLLINQAPALWAAAVPNLGKLQHGCSLCFLYRDHHHCANNHAFESCLCCPQLAKLGAGDTQR
jgi:hypothetical protein